MKQLAQSSAKLIFGNGGLVRRLEGMAWVHALAKKLRVREWMNAALARNPLKRRLSSGVSYNIETFEGLDVERTYFANPVFKEIFSVNPPETFIDLGCNCGIFPCLLADAAKGRAPRGFCVDANETQVELAKKNVALNGWKDVQVFCGLAGNAKEGDAEFFLAPTSTASSQFAYQETASGYPTDWKRVVVPSITVEPTWTKLFGVEVRCNCLKIDIEGSEMNFLQQEAGFLTRVDTILLEWHIWATTRDEVVNFLQGTGFRLERTIEDEPRHGVLYFVRADA